jgi:hypothetical protein
MQSTEDQRGPYPYMARLGHPLRQPDSVFINIEKIFIKPRHDVGLFISKEYYCCNRVSKYFMMFLALINFVELKLLLLSM